MKIILIGNYPPDQQESMKRFTEGLSRNLQSNKIDVKIWLPAIFFGSLFKSTSSGIGKWLGYVDKWILFPLILLCRLYLQGYSRKEYLFHICDHSNSPYIQYLPRERTIITCHDVLAIRGAYGFEDAYCPASATGRILQRWILKNLGKAIYLTTVSHFTMRQLLALLGKSGAELPSGWVVIHNTFNAKFSQMSSRESAALLEKYPGLEEPFLLHVGSGLLRKNREMLVDMLDHLKNKWQGVVCFAGEELNDDLKEKISKRNFQNKVIAAHKPDHDTLIALYSSCEAFIFPSFSEGFGWPVIEAQACGAPVIASNLEPMPEVSGGAALHASPNDSKEFADAFLKLNAPDFRNELIAAGFKNCNRFKDDSITTAYINLYNTVRAKV